MDKIYNALVIADLHVPFHSQKALDLVLDVALDAYGEQLDEIIINGDFVDFYNASSYTKDPAIKQMLRDEIEDAKDVLRYIKSRFSDKTKLTYVAGNHENRASKYIKNNAIDLYGLFRVEHLLELKEIGYDFVPYGPNQIYQIHDSRCFCRHEPLTGGNAPAISSLPKAGSSLVFGHIHKAQHGMYVNFHGEMYEGVSTGWLGDAKRYKEVFGYVKNKPNWCHGFTTVSVIDKEHYIQNVIIKDLKCKYNGVLYDGN